MGSVLLPSQEFIRFFDPRRDRWMEHFRLDELLITLLTGIGEVTARILGFNSDDRILERQTLMAASDRLCRGQFYTKDIEVGNY
jgi:hypothetical protein